MTWLRKFWRWFAAPDPREKRDMLATQRLPDSLPPTPYERWAQETDPAPGKRRLDQPAHKQRGIVLLALLPYLIGAAVVLGLLYGAYHWVDGTWQTSAGIFEGKRLEHDAMQPKLDSCNADLADATVKLATQSASIAAAASAAKASADNARKLADAARLAQADTRSEIQRLGDAIRKGPAVGACPAGAALAKVREGLR